MYVTHRNFTFIPLLYWDVLFISFQDGGLDLILSDMTIFYLICFFLAALQFDFSSSADLFAAWRDLLLSCKSHAALAVQNTSSPKDSKTLA